MSRDVFFDWFFKGIGTLAIPAFIWVISLSAERARVDLRIHNLEVQASSNKSSLKELETKINAQNQILTELKVSLGYIKASIDDIKEILKK